MGELVLAADLGGTNLRMAVVGRSGNVEHRSRCSTPRGNDPVTIINAVADLASECRKSIGQERLTSTIGVAAPVIVNAQNGTVYKAPNIPALNGFPFAARLSDRLGLKIVLENDATAAAVGEHWLGAARDFENAICVTLGTGVGGGIILWGRLLRG